MDVGYDHNASRRLPIYLLLGTSSSMAGAPIQAVNQGINLLYNELMNDASAIETVYLAVITFDSQARIVTPLTELTQFSPPTLSAGGARAMGAADCLDITEVTEEQRHEWLLERTAGRGPDVVIEATGVPRAVVQALRWVRDAGRVIVVGQYTDAGVVQINPHLDLNRKHLRVQGVWGSDFAHFYRAVELLRDARAATAFGHVATVEYTLNQMNEALADVAAGKTTKALARPNP